MAEVDYPVFVMCLDSDDQDLKTWYQERIVEHNEHVLTDPYPNSGFDLATPEDITILPTIQTTKVSTKVKGIMTHYGSKKCMGYYMYPRSSLAKTPLVLSNHVGVIDSGYRGPLTGAFRNLDTKEFILEKKSRQLQICHPNLSPFLVKMVATEQELGETSRGEGGFGSTGK